MFETPQADPKNVVSIILGGGAGTRLFPLTSRRAKPAVRCFRIYLDVYNFDFDFDFNFCFLVCELIFLEDF